MFGAQRGQFSHLAVRQITLAQQLTLLRAVLLNPLIEERHIRGLLDDQLRLGSLIASQLFDQTQQQGPVV